MKNRIVLILIAAIALLGVTAAFGADDAAAALYKSKCASCHGPDGSGQTTVGKSMKLRDLRSEDVQKQTEKEIEKIITDGKGKMPAYKGKISEAEIDGLVKYIKSLKK